MRALSVLLGAVALLLTTTVTPAQTETPAQRAKQIAVALQKDPLYVDPVYASALPETLRADVRAKAKALGFPVYSIVLPLTPGDVFQGRESNALTLVIDALRKPGLYVVVDGGSRFPLYEAHELPQLNKDKLSAARKRALDDTDFDSGPTQVLARMYLVLADPSLPVATPSSPSARADRDDDDSSTGKVVAFVALGIAVLVVLGLVIGLVRRTGGGGGIRGRDKPFSIPPHVAATVAAERRRRLTRETNQELTTLGSELAALPDAHGLGLEHQQAALDAHAAAAKVLDSSEDLVDVVGAMVLLDEARREYDAAVAVAADRSVADVPALCAFNPLHGRSTGTSTQVESDGATITLPLCAECRQALKRGKAPASLPGSDGPYWHDTDLWARTFFGALGNDLAAAVARGDHHPLDEFPRPVPSHLRQDMMRRKDGVMSADTQVSGLGDFDEPAFTGLAERHRRELHVHCYRMLGSFEDAEDTVQETFLRAWRRRETFEGRSTVRAWLYRIATNACLDLLAKHRPEPATGGEVLWLQPYPDRLLDELPAVSADEPETVAVARETIELAYLVAVQHLAPRPRAVLILRDVLGWPAKDVADLLGDSVNSVNSALQRARAGLRSHLPAERQDWTGDSQDAESRDLVRRYTEASVATDVEGIAALLRDDVRCSMPPTPGLYVGRDAVVSNWREDGFEDLQGLRTVSTSVNRQPAIAFYQWHSSENAYLPLTVDVLRISDKAIAEITTFHADQFPHLGLPAHLTD